MQPTQGSSAHTGHRHRSIPQKVSDQWREPGRWVGNKAPQSPHGLHGVVVVPLSEDVAKITIGTERF